ncbi:hypothetical protein MITSMUL_03814 [Mitsuokella multacida DSM 20544]|uniref:Major facilitator superfamily (MFS) profile domain-containing protein n=2 Tax=Mitsuokella multacida TaxID=52226 RepID=C9KKW3_9FIRM|nr:hypothetical protein MITSMUL_03814 [Mitsuokella multacida DSM 20544]
MPRASLEVDQMRNRWLIALSAVGIHISIGSVYAWSVLTRPIMKEMGFSLAETTWTFSLAILFLGFSAGFLGSFVEKIGPKKSGLIAMAFFGTGMLGTAYAIAAQSLTLLYLFYGVIGGIGLGVGYITPVSTLVKYFPDHRGFATRLAIMGFGFAALIAGPVMQYLTATVGLVNNFLILGCVYMLIMGASSLYLKPPVLKDSTGKVTHIQQGVTANEALKTWQFASLWWIFFVNITCGVDGRHHRRLQRRRAHRLVDGLRLHRPRPRLHALLPARGPRVLAARPDERSLRL